MYMDKMLVLLCEGEYMNICEFGNTKKKKEKEKKKKKKQNKTKSLP